MTNGRDTGTTPPSRHAKLSAMSKFLPYEEALAVAQSLGLATRVEWKAWGKEGMRPANVPSNPNRTYKHDGWQGWGHWLGTGNQLMKQFLPFDKAQGACNNEGFVKWQELLRVCGLVAGA